MAVGQDHNSRPGGAGSPAGHGRHRRPAARSVDSLLRRVARGDTEAFAEVCDQVTGAVYGVVSRIVGGQSHAEQVTEGVLLEVWQSASRFSPAEGSGLSWIMTMARRRAISQAGTAGDSPAAGPEPSRAAGLAAERVPGSLLAYRGINALPAPQREAMLLTCCGYTGRQVAELAGAPAGTVAGWLRDGLLRLSSHPE